MTYVSEDSQPGPREGEAHRGTVYVEGPADVPPPPLYSTLYARKEVAMRR